MSWVEIKPLNWFQKICVKVLQCGKIPQHVAIIMDGNRRHARVKNVHKFEAHLIGQEKLVEVLSWGLELGIPEVTLYTFSMDNFKRTSAEVNMLMKLLKSAFDDSDYYMKYDLELRVVGNISLLPLVVQKSVAKGILLSKKKKRQLVINLAVAYSAHEEMTMAIKTIASGVGEGKLELSDINEQLISGCLYTNKSPNPDLVIRTGEIRLSDFLLWQLFVLQEYLLATIQLLGHVFSITLLPVSFLKLTSLRECEESMMSQSPSERVVSFLVSVDNQRHDQLECILELKD